jgi:hypothetical protein
MAMRDTQTCRDVLLLVPLSIRATSIRCNLSRCGIYDKHSSRAKGLCEHHQIFEQERSEFRIFQVSNRLMARSSMSTPNERLRNW